jgi:hypothetical protein
MIASEAFQTLLITMRFTCRIHEVEFTLILISSPNDLYLRLVVDLALNRIPNDLRPAVIDIMNQSKSSPSQKRALLLKKGLLRSTTDELEILAEVGKKLVAFCSTIWLPMVFVLQKMMWMCYELSWRGCRRHCSR